MTKPKSSYLAYKSYHAMLERCYKADHPKAGNYKNIFVCERWLESFDNFLEDMGERPSKDYSLDRIDSNKGYFLENCRWADITTQNRNRGISKRNSSGFVGVSKTKEGRWRASIEARLNGKRKTYNLGTYDRLEEAVQARKEGELKHWS